MNWSISGMSPGPTGGTICQPTKEFRGRYLRHPIAYGKEFPTCDAAFAYMHEVCGEISWRHYERPYAFISCKLPRATRRHLRAMRFRVRWDCLVRLGGGGQYMRAMRSASYMRPRRDAWERYIMTGKDAPLSA